MGCAGAGCAEGRMEEELCVPGWSLHGAWQSSEGSICMFPDGAALAPLLSTFQLCILPFFLPNSCFYFLEIRGNLWCMECPVLPCFAYQWDITSKTAVSAVVSALYLCVWYDGRSMFLH